MGKIPMGFKRISAAFDDGARARLCESSGSEHSAAAAAAAAVVVEKSSAELSELVESFLERDCGVEEECCEDGEWEEERSRNESSESYNTEMETKKMLMSLIEGESGEGEDGCVRRMIQAEMESACRRSGRGSPEGFKRRVMSWLRQRGFDAGLCKSQWERTAESLAGEHQYIDITMARTRYIVEVSPATHFTIARPTDPYASLLKLFPRILVCEEDKLRMVVRLMCAAMKQSLKKMEMHVPPWRKNAYVQAMWFGPYRRTTNPVPATEVSLARGGASAGKSSVGFETLQEKHSCCRGEAVRKVGFGVGVGVVGNLNAASNGMH